MSKKHIKTWKETKAIAAMEERWLRMNDEEKDRFNNNLSTRLQEIEEIMTSSLSIHDLKSGWDDLDSLIVNPGNHHGRMLLAACRNKGLTHLRQLGLLHPLPTSQAALQEAWLNKEVCRQRANKEENNRRIASKLRREKKAEETAKRNQELLREWISTYELDEEISFVQAKKIALNAGWSEDPQLVKDVLMDKRIWEQILERMPARSQLYARERLRTNTGIASIIIQRGKFLVRMELKTKKGYEGIIRLFGLDSEFSAELEKAATVVFALKGYLPQEYKGRDIEVTDETTAGIEADWGYVYFVRNQDLYKIGITADLLRRLRELRPDEVLNIVRCLNYQEIERELHLMFSSKRVPQTEYFRLEEHEITSVHKFLQERAS